MTNEEAVSELKYARAMLGPDPMTEKTGFRNDEDRRRAEALDIAIRALEQPGHAFHRNELLEAVCGEIVSAFDVSATCAYDIAEKIIERA